MTPPEADLTSDILDGSLDTGAVAPPPGTQSHAGADSRPQTIKDAPSGEAAKPDNGLSLRDQLSSAFKGPEGDDAPKPDANGILRTKDGKFANKDEEAKEAARVAAAPPADQQQQAAVVNAPAVLTPQQREQFAKLPAEMQQFVARTMEEANAMSQRASSIADIVPLIDQRREMWAVNGIMPGQAIGTLLAMNDFCTRDPAGFIRHIANSYSVDLDGINEGIEPLDPRIADLQGQVRTLNSQLGQFTTGQQQQQHNAVLSEVQNFGQEKDAGGNPVRPHFFDVADDINALIPHIRAQNPNMPHRDTLQAAYDRAVWANPITREKVLASQRASQEAERLASQRGEAGRAAAAAVSVTGVAPGTGDGGAASSGSRTLREELAAQFAAAGAHV